MYAVLAFRYMRGACVSIFFFFLVSRGSAGEEVHVCVYALYVFYFCGRDSVVSRGHAGSIWVSLIFEVRSKAALGEADYLMRALVTCDFLCMRLE